MSNPVVHWEITSKEPGKAQEFYSKLFDWHVPPERRPAA